jgi:hypothetical protein
MENVVPESGDVCLLATAGAGAGGKGAMRLHQLLLLQHALKSRPQVSRH